MTVLRAMVVHKHQSGLPRDNVVNTFHFHAPGESTAAEREQVAESVRDFYVVNPAGETTDVAEWFSDAISNTGHEVRIYELDTFTGVQINGDGADPSHVEVFDHLGRDGAANGALPAEVACRLSMKAGSPANVPSRRRRGGIYLGPFHQGVLVEEGVTERAIVPPGLRTLFIKAAQELQARQAAAAYDWVVYSRPTEGRPAGRFSKSGKPLQPIAARQGAPYLVSTFFVDNAWDTVRRRGERGTARTIG